MLQRLFIQNFRNYTRQELWLDPGVNVFLGDNGQGKTNLLEAVYYLSLLRSFRTNQQENLVQAGADGFSLYGETAGTQGLPGFRLGVSGVSQRRLMVDGVPVHRASDFISKLVCIAFAPEDIALIKGAPAQRRQFLDIALCQSSPEYMSALRAFRNGLRQRNAMLKCYPPQPEAVVTAWNKVIAENAGIIEAARQEFARNANQTLQRLSPIFFPDGRVLSVNFLSGITHIRSAPPETPQEICQEYLLALEKNYQRDCRDGATKLGPHHSELACLINGRLLNVYGSEGECRTAAIALKLAMLELLRNSPAADQITMLVDDVLGELDATRRQAFFRLLTSAGQVLFAGTAMPPELAAANPRVFLVGNGAVRMP